MNCHGAAGTLRGPRQHQELAARVGRARAGIDAIAAEVLEGDDLRARHAGRGDAGAGRHLLRDALHHRAIAARVVERRQEQGHHEQPADADAARRQDQALPQRVAMAAGAPAHQPEPGEGPGQRQREGEARERVGVAGRELGDVGRELGRRAGLHGDVEDPACRDGDGEEEHREPVDRRGGAALAASAARTPPARPARAARASARGRCPPSPPRSRAASSRRRAARRCAGWRGGGAIARASTARAARRARRTRRSGARG